MNPETNFIVGIVITCVFAIGVGGYCIWKKCAARARMTPAMTVVSFTSRVTNNGTNNDGEEEYYEDDGYAPTTVMASDGDDEDEDDDTVLFSRP